MKLYEAMFLLDNERANKDWDAAAAQVHEILERHGCRIVKSEKWGERKLAYRGQLDDSRPGNDLPVTGADLRAAIEAVLAGQPVPEDQKPSLGCNIKWRPGNEPPYFGG